MNQNFMKKYGMELLLLLVAAAALIAAVVISQDQQTPPGTAGVTPPGVQQAPLQTDPDTGEVLQVPPQTDPDTGEVLQVPPQTDPTTGDVQQDPSQTDPTTGDVQQDPTQTDPTTGQDTQPPADEPIDLGYGLCITEVGAYTGAYMEDGSNEDVEGVMMIVVSNEGPQDVQLADVAVLCGDAEYQFRLTNLAAGAQAMLLETGRKCPQGAFSSAELRNVAVFDEPMALHEDRIKISGGEGFLTVRNISGANIPADIFVYYKYAGDGQFSGGITFRIRVEGGLKSDEELQIPAGHYSPETCTIVQVSIYE